MVMGTFLFKEELSVAASLCLAEDFQLQGHHLQGSFPACTRIYLQLLRCWLRGQESQFSLDCLLAPCTWQRNLLAGENSVFGACTEPLSTLEESWVLWMSANLPPHTMLTHGVCPICLSLSILGNCHHSIEVPLV